MANPGLILIAFISMSAIATGQEPEGEYHLPFQVNRTYAIAAPAQISQCVVSDSTICQVTVSNDKALVLPRRAEPFSIHVICETGEIFGVWAEPLDAARKKVSDERLVITLKSKMTNSGSRKKEASPLYELAVALAKKKVPTGAVVAEFEGDTTIAKGDVEMKARYKVEFRGYIAYVFSITNMTKKEIFFNASGFSAEHLEIAGFCQVSLAAGETCLGFFIFSDEAAIK